MAWRTGENAGSALVNRMSRRRVLTASALSVAAGLVAATPASALAFPTMNRKNKEATMTTTAGPIELLSLVALALLFLLWTAELLCAIWINRARVLATGQLDQGGAVENARAHL